MIEFNVVQTDIKIRRKPKSYPKLVEYEADFSILVNGKLFFHEPNFPLLEFLHFVTRKKIENGGSVDYISIETEENPLISFIYEDDMFTISSPWQLFECETKFSKEQIISALDKLEKQI